jgi:type II secretory pathway pseudopilin PulG
MNDLPKGFYTGPDGRERFWDGNEWFDSGSEPAAKEPKQSVLKTFQGLNRRSKIIISSATAFVLIAIISSSVVVIQNHNAEVAAKQLATQQEQERQSAAAAAATAAAAEAEADLQNRRDNRKRAVSEIEASVRTMAEKHVSEGLLHGPIISVTCTTTGGVSIEDISIRSTLFECFAANTDNGDGTLSGVYYHARANWDDGTWTYGPGRG